MIRGITFSEQEFRSEDFAHFQNFFLNGNHGITKGCIITQDDTSVSIGVGNFLVCGRFIQIEDVETISSADFHNGYNRIVFEIDLTKENTVTEFNQGKIRVLPTTDLIQQDLDNGGNIYQFPFCHFNWEGTAISAFGTDAKQLVMADMWADVIATIESMLGKIESIIKKNVAVSAASFVSDATYGLYPYKANIAITGVTSDYVANVYFDVPQADSGIFSTVTDAETDRVVIYAKEAPSEDFIIPTIKCDKGASV